MLSLRLMSTMKRIMLVVLHGIAIGYDATKVPCAGSAHNRATEVERKKCYQVTIRISFIPHSNYLHQSICPHLQNSSRRGRLTTILSLCLPEALTRLNLLQQTAAIRQARRRTRGHRGWRGSTVARHGRRWWHASGRHRWRRRSTARRHGWWWGCAT